MATFFSTHGRRVAYLATASLAMMGLSIWYSGDAPAQVKKTVSTPPAGSNVRDVYASTQGGSEQVMYMNELIEKQWSDNKIRPANRCSDYEFIRRASLDIVGRIATPEEVKRFMNDPETRRRSLLIDRLLDNPEFGENFANMYTTMLLTRQGSKKVHQEQMRDWLTDKFNDKSADWTKITNELVTATGYSNENQAVNFVLHHMGDQIRNDPGNGAWDMVPVTSRTTRLFLGLRTQCVQCHDHPFNGEWQQRHFWGINAFYRQTNASGRPGMMNQKKKKGEIDTGRFELRDESNLNTNGLVPFERRSGVLLYARPTFLDETKMDLKKTDKSRRQVLSNFITKSPYFAKAFVNRTWAHFFGKSFTKDAPDDFGEHNPVSNPELLEKLAKDWSENYGHSPRHLIRWICNTRAYGLSSVSNETNDKPEDEVYFSRMIMKQMTPEQLFESVILATEMKSVQGDKKAKGIAKEAWMDMLVQNFGNDEGEEVSFNGTVVQALLLMNGKDINEAINGASVFQGKGVAAATNEKQILDSIYMMTLNRPAKPDEFDRIMVRKDKDTGLYLRSLPRVPNPRPELMRAEFYKDILWAVLNSNEFILNH